MAKLQATIGNSIAIPVALDTTWGAIPRSMACPAVHEAMATISIAIPKSAEKTRRERGQRRREERQETGKEKAETARESFLHRLHARRCRQSWQTTRHFYF